MLSKLRVGAILLEDVGPGRTSAQLPENAVEPFAVVHPSRLARPIGQQWLNDRALAASDLRAAQFHGAPLAIPNVQSPRRYQIFMRFAT